MLTQKVFLTNRTSPHSSFKVNNRHGTKSYTIHKHIAQWASTKMNWILSSVTPPDTLNITTLVFPELGSQKNGILQFFQLISYLFYSELFLWESPIFFLYNCSYSIFIAIYNSILWITTIYLCPSLYHVGSLKFWAATNVLLYFCKGYCWA